MALCSSALVYAHCPPPNHPQDRQAMPAVLHQKERTVNDVKPLCQYKTLPQGISSSKQHQTAFKRSSLSPSIRLKTYLDKSTNKIPSRTDI